MKKTKILVSMAVAALAILGTYTTAFADAGAYAIKDTKTNIIRQYDLKSLTESFLSNKIGQGNDLLFKEFKEDQGKNGVHAIYDDSKKYISYAEAVKALEEVKISGKEFQLNGFLKEAKAGETPNYVYERKVSGEKVVNGLNITKEGFELDLSKEVLETYEDVKVTVGQVIISNGTITGKLLVDAGKDAAVTVKNIVTDAITGLSGSLKLEAVQAKELVIEKALSLNVDTASKLTKLSITAPKGTEIVLSGNLGAVEVSSAVKLTITAGSKVDVKIANDEAKEITVVAEAGSTVTTDQPITNTEGSGTITGPVTPTPGGGGGGVVTPAENADLDNYITAVKGALFFYAAMDNKFSVTLGNSSTPTQITITDAGLKSKTLDELVMTTINKSITKSFSEVSALQGLFNNSSNKVTLPNGTEGTLYQYIAAKLVGKPHSTAAIAYFTNPNETTFNSFKTAIQNNANSYIELSQTIQEIVPFNSENRSINIPRMNIKGLNLSTITITKGSATATITPGQTTNISAIKTSLGLTAENTTLSQLSGSTVSFTFQGVSNVYTYQFALIAN